MHHLRVLKTRRPLAAGLAALALTVALPARAAEPTACPDLTGTWTIPGRDRLPTACAELWQNGDLFWPGEGGFYRSALAEHPITIRQDRCDRLTLSVRLEGYPDATGQRGPDEPHDIVLDLRPSRGRTVTWGERSLTWRQTYTPAGFRFPPWRREVMVLELAVQQGGRLAYELRQETRGRRRLMGVRCGFGG
jgi:hypothetical protein